MGRDWMHVEDASPYYGVKDEHWEDFATDRKHLLSVGCDEFPRNIEEILRKK